MNNHKLRKTILVSISTFFFSFLSLSLVLAAEAGIKPAWSFWDRLNVLLTILLLFGAICWFLYRAGKGKKLYVRSISGISALDEAIGRATEMGKPVLFIAGIMDVDDIQTLAGLSILGYVAKKTAEYESSLLMPCLKAIVMSTAQEVVKEAHLKAGKPDTYKKENVFYLTEDQFGFAAGVDGIMLREKPAANFFLGRFFAESLILAETGFSVGAIQIAGTAELSQIPFFVTACDYTLIGEELYAASAYLSKDPHQISSLKGQDIAKVLIVSSIIIGSLCATFIKSYPQLGKFIELFTIK